jgi:hypothetical protein
VLLRVSENCSASGLRKLRHLVLPHARPLSLDATSEAVVMSERGQARRTRHFALSGPSVRRKRHESAMNSVIGRGRGTALLPPGTGESQEGCSHASSTSQSKLVAHPVGFSA